MLRRSTAILLFSLILIPAVLCASEPVRIWEDTLVVPTYPAARPERAPLFYEGRTYQGAKGPIYPYPIIDKLIDTREDRPYKAVISKTSTFASVSSPNSAAASSKP